MTSPDRPSTTRQSVSSEEFIEEELDRRVIRLEEELDGDVLCFVGDLEFGVDDILRRAVEQLSAAENRREKLCVVLTTLGGYIEVVQRIVDTFRHHYGLVEFIVPNYAFSAGTVLVMSGDEIYMDYYSRLGPIDPQRPGAGGQFVPGMGYVERYNALIEKAEAGVLTDVEAQLLLFGFDQGMLSQVEHQRELSITLLKQWLSTYKFKNWDKTESRGVAVTQQMRVERAERIAAELSNTQRWHIHGFGISREMLTTDPKLDLRIEDFGADPQLNEAVRGYYEFLTDYMDQATPGSVVHTRLEFVPFLTREGGNA